MFDVDSRFVYIVNAVWLYVQFVHLNTGHNTTTKILNVSRVGLLALCVSVLLGRIN